MNANGQTRDIGYQNNPPMTARTVGLIFPLQNQPEHQGREKTGEGIDLGLDCREPERVAKGIDQCTHYAAGLNDDDLRHALRLYQFTNKVRDGEKQKEDTARTQECRQDIHHQCHLRWLTGKL